VRDFLNEFFTANGYTVIEAENGKEALGKFDKENPELAIVDVEMPVMDGLVFSQRILKANPNFPIIMITAFLEKYSKNDIMEMGVKEVVDKPFDLEYLLKVVESCL
jgi:DNA-binding response OmpR family regulator